MLLAMSSEKLAGGGDWHSIRKDAAVMTKNRIPRNPTKDGAFRQIEGIAVDLPPPETKRWVPRRKAAIVNAVRSGAVSLEEVCRRYELSVEEIITWQRAIEAHGVTGLVRRSKGPSERVIRTGKLVVNLDTRVATVDGRPMHLTGKEYGILELLSLRKGTTLTKEMFLNHLYGGMDEPALKIIDVFVCKLRKKLALATGGKHYIETVWGRGHVLRDPAPVPAATPVVTLERLGGRPDAAGTRAARNAPLGELTRRRPKLHRRSVGSSND
jgi:two-component system cell cycle response regulator CtrA